MIDKRERTEVIDHWLRVGEALYYAGDEHQDDSHAAALDLGRACWTQNYLAKKLVNRDFDLKAHRWFHTIGSPTLQLLHSILSATPGAVGVLGFRVAEDLFHLGYLAGVASTDKDLRREIELVSVDDAALCLDNGNAGVRTIERLQKEGFVPQFKDEDLDILLRLKKELSEGSTPT